MFDGSLEDNSVNRFLTQCKICYFDYFEKEHVAPGLIALLLKYDNVSSELTYGENLGLFSPTINLIIYNFKHYLKQFGMNQLVQFKCYAKLVMIDFEIIISTFTSTLPNNCKDISTVQNENSTEIISFMDIAIAILKLSVFQLVISSPIDSAVSSYGLKTYLTSLDGNLLLSTNA
ncbi:hypothetical protein ACTA71_012417 [Dictyostelium dimigraforme]